MKNIHLQLLSHSSLKKFTDTFTCITLTCDHIDFTYLGTVIDEPVFSSVCPSVCLFVICHHSSVNFYETSVECGCRMFPLDD